MNISRIELDNFRNHHHLAISDIGSVLVIVGDNAVGKTNIIEALQLISMHESFRHPKTEELINRDSDGERASVLVELERDNNPSTKQIIITNEGRSFLFNKKARVPKDILEVLPSVLFTPDDLQIIKGSPEQRRDLLDSLGARLSKTFGQIRTDYYKALRQKNSLLKQEEVDREVLDSWNHHLALLGASLTKHRQGLCKQLVLEASTLYTQISGGETLTGTYVVSWFKEDEEQETEVIPEEEREERILKEEDFYEAFFLRRETEVAAKRSLVGPHKDDIFFRIDGTDARRFASQGQQRSIALALKMAEIEILRRVSGKNPLLLLDDVMSELDSSRREYFVELIGGVGQTVLTTTNLGYFEQDFLERATVVELKGDSHGQ